MNTREDDIICLLERYADSIFENKYKNTIVEGITDAFSKSSENLNFDMYYYVILDFNDYLDENIPNSLRDFVYIKIPQTKLYNIVEVVLEESIYLIISLLDNVVLSFRYDIKNRIISIHTEIFKLLVELHACKCLFNDCDVKTRDIVRFSRIFTSEDRICSFLESLFYIYEASDRRMSSIQEKKIYTYILKWDRRGLYKIGKSSNIKSRFRNLSSSNDEISILAFLDENIESDLHKQYSEKRRFGEWFALTDEDVEHIIRIHGFALYEEMNID